jgi:hypothetical protein
MMVTMMGESEVPDAELLATSLGLLRAHLAGDEESVNSMLDAADARILLAVTVGLLMDRLDKALPGGARELDEWLAGQQERYRGNL